MLNREPSFALHKKEMGFSNVVTFQLTLLAAPENAGNLKNEEDKQTEKSEENSYLWKKVKLLDVAVNQILLEFYRWMWHRKLIYCTEELHLQPLSDCCHTPSSQGSLEFFLLLFIPSLSAFHFILFFCQMKFHTILSLRNPSNWLFKEELSMDTRTCTPGELKNKSPEQGFEFSPLMKKCRYYLLLEKTLLCRPESEGSRKLSDY